MGNKSNEQRGNFCDGKHRFTSFEEANKQVAHLNQNKRTRKMKSYRCAKCGGVHNGHDQRKKMSNQTKPTYIPDYNPAEVKRGNQDEILRIKLPNK
jgi:hypothetical protein